MILMKLNPQTFARESSLVMGAVYVVCAAFVALFPEFSTKLLGWFIHVSNLELIQRGVSMTWGGFIAGLGQTFLYGYVFAGLFAWLFNRSVRA